MGGKTREIIFPENTKCESKKCWEKSSEKMQRRFLYSHEYRDQKMGEKSEKQFFQKHTISANTKKIVRKKCNKRFLYSHEYRKQKMG